MSTVEFYEKPGCINNTRQKQLLREAGHIVIERDLLHTHWTEEGLMVFFSALPIHEWFNHSAPQIKSGEVIPEQCSMQQALSLMCDIPLLIRRPLMRVGHGTMVGFEQDAVDAWIGLQCRSDADLETCPRPSQKPDSIAKNRL